MKEREIIIELLQKNILFCNYMRYLYWGGDEVAGQTLVMFVNCNELFYPGADAETIDSEEDLKLLYELWKKHSYTGIDLWVIKKRKEQPMQSIKQSLIENGLWEEEFNNFEVNNN